MNENNAINEIHNLTDEQLLELYQIVTAHLEYLQGSILDPSLGGEENE